MYITIKEAIEIARVSRPTLYSRIRNKKIQLYKNGGKSFLIKNDVENLFEPVEYVPKIINQ